MNLILLEKIQMYTERRAKVDNQVEREEIMGVARPGALDPQELWVKGLGHMFQRRYYPAQERILFKWAPESANGQQVRRVESWSQEADEHQ